MNRLISEQIFEMAVMIYAGAVTMFFIDLLNLYNKKSKSRKIFLTIQDMLCWTFIALIVVSFLYYSSYGRLSWQIVPEYILGIIIYRHLLSEIVSKSVEKIISLFLKQMKHFFINSRISSLIVKNEKKYAIIKRKQMQRAKQNEKKTKRKKAGKLIKRNSSEKGIQKNQ